MTSQTVTKEKTLFKDRPRPRKTKNIGDRQRHQLEWHFLLSKNSYNRKHDKESEWQRQCPQRDTLLFRALFTARHLLILTSIMSYFWEKNVLTKDASSLLRGQTSSGFEDKTCRHSSHVGLSRRIKSRLWVFGKLREGQSKFMSDGQEVYSKDSGCRVSLADSETSIVKNKR